MLAGRTMCECSSAVFAVFGVTASMATSRVLELCRQALTVPRRSAEVRPVFRQFDGTETAKTGPVSSRSFDELDAKSSVLGSLFFIRREDDVKTGRHGRSRLETCHVEADPRVPDVRQPVGLRPAGLRRPARTARARGGLVRRDAEELYERQLCDPGTAARAVVAFVA